LTAPGPNIDRFIDFAAKVAFTRSENPGKLAGEAATEDMKEHLEETELRLREPELDGWFRTNTPVKKMAFP